MFTRSLVCSRVLACVSFLALLVSSPVAAPRHTLQGPDDKKLVNRVQDNRCLSTQTHFGVRLLNARVPRTWAAELETSFVLRSVPHATTVTTANCLFSKSSTTLCYVPVSLGFVWLFFAAGFFFLAFTAPFRFDNFSLKHRSTESELSVSVVARTRITLNY